MEFWKGGSRRAGSRYAKEVYAESILELWDRHGAVSILERRYSRAIQDVLEAILGESRSEGVKEEEYWRVYVGSVFNMFPSGQYWTFWACSNMRMKEMCWDTIYTEVLEEVLDAQGGWPEEGEGDPTDVFFCFPLPVEQEGPE